jgi:hypothetical protein
MLAVSLWMYADWEAAVTLWLLLQAPQAISSDRSAIALFIFIVCNL